MRRESEAARAAAPPRPTVAPRPTAGQVATGTTATATRQAAAVPEADDGYEAQTVETLKDIIRGRNEDGREDHILLSGHKDELIERLRDDDRSASLV